MYERGKSKERPKVKQMKYLKVTEFKIIIKTIHIVVAYFMCVCV